MWDLDTLILRVCAVALNAVQSFAQLGPLKGVEKVRSCHGGERRRRGGDAL